MEVTAVLNRLRLRHGRTGFPVTLFSYGVEAFNVLNHTQFFGPQAVDGNISSATFGEVINADPPRLVQLGAKLFF